MNETKVLEKLLGSIFDSLREGLRAELPPLEYDSRRQDFIFHMLDWKSDLDALVRVLDNPDLSNVDAASDALMGFLYHALPHLNAAGKLLLDEIKDPFASEATQIRPGP